MKEKLSYSTIIYVLIVAIVGISMFSFFGGLVFDSLSDWVIGYTLIASGLILCYYKIQLPPLTNNLSLDTSIYLACLFMFGLETALIVLFYVSIIYIFMDNKVKWWMDLFNFSSYTFMLVLTYYTFVGLGGTTGAILIDDIFAFAGAFSVYFISNLLVVAIYFRLHDEVKLHIVLKDMLNGTIETYITTLLLSLVCGLLIQSAGFFGVTLFVAITVILTYIFRQHFDLYKKVQKKANSDHLTGLVNHGHFKELLEVAIEEAEHNNLHLTLAMIDLDDFKKYNDSFGHVQGDRLLVHFGDTLANASSDEDYILARYGGEEFVILFKNTEQERAAKFIDVLRKSVNDTYFEGVEVLPYGCLSFSAGIAEWQDDMENYTNLLDHADQAMYYAKSQGKNNTHIFGKEMEIVNLDTPLEEMEQQLKLFRARDIYTYRHSKRVFKYAVEFGKWLNLDEYERKVLMLGALIHDIGKLEVPREVINKKGKLTEQEWKLIQKHVEWGKEIVSLNAEYEDILPLVELHHERYDGAGYPKGLKEEEIPKLARILCVVDSFDAMTTERPYQKTKTFEEAIDEISRCSGTQFDPYFAKEFIAYISKNYLSDSMLRTV
ncbi:bifunctional diguanylate cyclase/phosphohydrolase [Saliterribacillus persicus]|uniref:Diguanylate cyclase (GGDEF)-like protein/putative nucleotidyltransferase with HDIG domain n=1 Tax=Saliterribacillus persicus TaxID=930114 RepID=A0A368XNN3_9BACI|nr:HD-GYP domain-containing protein [Saliterribacillus persicus]RCW69622.1 diguanylate cyclase (GGDEF)-like protein/putative nucleotidyltransferase with HDIG domain [Saliterribacillus persicus]